MKFETKRLLLRPWEETDAKSLYQYASNPKVGPIAGWPVHTSVEDSLCVIRNVLSAPETYAVCLKEDNTAIGSIGLISPMQSHTKAAKDEIEVGYWIGVPFWGNGYIPEAVREMQRHAFEDLGLNGMWCGYYDGNEKSKRCQEKCGFRFHHTEENKPCELMGDVRTEHFTYISKEQWEAKNLNNTATAVLYIHGKGGSADEAEHYRTLFPQCDVYGLDYHSFTPWETGAEINTEVNILKEKYNKIILIANSIGAFFSMNAGIEKDISKAYFISPIVDMENLICNMMKMENVSEEELQRRETIETGFGESLSWKYLSFVRKHPITWMVQTDVLYGSKDQLTPVNVISAFTRKYGANLEIMEGGEHWFHTQEQMKFLDSWIKKH